MSCGRRNPILFPLLILIFSALLVGVSPAGPDLRAAPQGGGNKTIYVGAVDPANKAVPDIPKDGWALKEDGADRSIVDAKPATDPIDVVLMIDTTLNSQPTIADLRTALHAFAETLFGTQTPVNLSIMDVAAADVMVAQDKKSFADVDKTLGRTFSDRAGNAVFLEGAIDAAKKLGKSPTKRRVIVIVNTDATPDASSQNAMNTVIQQTVASAASVWAVTYENNATRSMAGGGAEGSSSASAGVAAGGVGQGNVGQALELYLSKVPEGTGGLRVHLSVATGLTETLTKFANDILGQYAITYTRPDGPMPRTVDVGVAKTGVTVLWATSPPK